MTRFLTGLGLAVAVLLAAYLLEGGWPLALLALTPFLITFFVPLFAVLAVWSGRQLGASWRAAFRPAPSDESKLARDLWAFAETACYLSGLLAALTGGILMMGNATQVSPADLGHHFGALLVGPTYGVLFGLIFRILRARIEVLSGS